MRRGRVCRVRALAVLTLQLVVPTAPAFAGQSTLEQAREHFAAARYEQASAVLQELADERPNDGEVHLLMGRVQLALGALEAAERHLAAARDAAGATLYRVSHAMGQLRIEQRDYAGAVTELDDAIARAPGFAGALVRRAQARAMLGRVDEALVDLAGAASRSERLRPIARLLAGELLLVTGRAAEAFAEFRAVAEEGTDQLAGENAAMYLGTLGPSPRETEGRIRRGMSRVLNRPSVFFWAAMLRRDLNDPAGAHALLALALAVDEQHAPSWLLAASLTGAADPAAYLASTVGEPLPGLEHRMDRLRDALDGGATAMAEEDARRVLAARPRFLPAHVLLLDAARERGEPLVLLERLRAMARIGAPIPSIHVDVATLANRLGALDLAERHARLAIGLLPGDGSLRQLLANVLLALGRHAEAASEAELAIEGGYETSSLRVTLGNAYQEMQRLPEAVAALERAVELDPASAELVAGFALQAMTGAGADGLVQRLEAALQESPDSPNMLYTVGSHYLRSGNAERALPAFERLATLAPAESDVQYNLALVYRRLGREVEANAATARFEELKASENATWERANETYMRRTRAVMALAADDPSTAVAMMQQVVGAPGSEPDDHVLLGSALLAADRTEDASAAFARAIEILPYDPGARCGAAVAATRLGNEIEATAHRNAVATLGATCPDASD